MLNLNLNTLSSKLTEQPRGVFQGLVSASFVLYGGGGAGGINELDGGGGGAGMVVSSSIHIVPNVTYNVIVGAGGSGSLTTAFNGEDSFIYGFTQLPSIPMSAKAGGGKAGPVASGSVDDARKGGNSGDGYVYLRPGVSSSYPAFLGGNGDFEQSGGFGPNFAAGGGAGSGENGENGVAGRPGTGANSGDGGDGALVISSSLQTFGYYSSSLVTSYSGYDELNNPIDTALGAAGGGAGGSSATATTGLGGNWGGGDENAPFFERIAWGPGAGGCGSFSTGGGSGNGGDGRCFLIYCGLPKMDVTNATTTYDTVHNRTIHLFNKGTGSFYFDFEKYGAIEGCQ
jgi:hypothetical protein